MRPWAIQQHVKRHKMPSFTSSTIYTIPPGISFVKTLAAGLLQETAHEPEKLASYLIMLPTRRACRALQEAFLQETDGKPLLLPRLQPLGDIDEEELFISGQGQEEVDIPPAMPALKRQILLAQAISKLPDFSRGPEQDIAFAGMLGQLMDQIHTENLNLSDLPNIVDREVFAHHWQITVDFLKILSEHWPKILQEHGLIDTADRRNRLIKALNSHWQKAPPDYPVIAAGSTGSIPATGALLKTISTLPQGSVILPGLDQNMSQKAWELIEEGHPQATLKHLLNNFDLERQDIKNWPHCPALSEQDEAREKLISHVMVPSEATDEWQHIVLPSKDKELLHQTLNNIKRYDCPTPQDEAQLIALLLRETLEDKNKIAALITPDRNLAKRVTMMCRRWNIEIDDSAGFPLNQSLLGTYLYLCAQALIDNIQPLSLLALLKHDYCHGGDIQNFRSLVRRLEYIALRGPSPQPGFDNLKQHVQNQTDDTHLLNFVDQLEKIILPFTQKLSDGYHSFQSLLEDHIRFAETLTMQAHEQNILWRGDEGEAAAIFLSDLKEHAHAIPPLTGHDYLAVLNNLMKSVTIRPRFGTHPRLMILGQLEARLAQADRVIMAGLNEGVWPPNPGHDPWMSRPMRQNFGLPTAERSLTLAAHDFTQGFCTQEVFLTRSERSDGTPTVPARWLQRLDSFLQSMDIDPNTLQKGPHQNYITLLNKQDNIQPFERPAPTPPLSARPRKLSVTRIETWLKDPYAIYAKDILRLKKLDPIDKQPDAAERGNIIHSILERFTDKYKTDIPDDAVHDFIAISKDILEEKSKDPNLWGFWSPRLIRLAEWLIPHERKWRKDKNFVASEVSGKVTFSDNVTNPFTLTARADRVDYIKGGGAAIIDYKSGGQFSVNGIQTSALPQLPLEALILNEGGFSEAGVKAQKVKSVSYWKLTGGTQAAEVKELCDPQKIEQTITLSKTGLMQLINVFDNDTTPYLALPRLENAPRFNDYEHLERVKEWAVLGDSNEEAA